MAGEEEKKERIKYYSDLVERYNIKERYMKTLEQIQDVIVALNLMDKVRIDLSLLDQAILSYFEDIDRLKLYEGIDRANVSKIYSYGTFWLLREKPIQIISEELEKKYVHINERVFSMILVSKILAEADISFTAQNDKLLPFMELLYYNFKYRIFTQKSLELMITAFLTGCRFSTYPQNLQNGIEK